MCDGGRKNRERICVQCLVEGGIECAYARGKEGACAGQSKEICQKESESLQGDRVWLTRCECHEIGEVTMK